MPHPCTHVSLYPAFLHSCICILHSSVCTPASLHPCITSFCILQSCTLHSLQSLHALHSAYSAFLHSAFSFFAFSAFLHSAFLHSAFGHSAFICILACLHPASCLLPAPLHLQLVEALSGYEKASFTFNEKPKSQPDIQSKINEAMITETEARLMAGFQDKSLSKVALRRYVQVSLRRLGGESSLQELLDPRIQAKVKAALLLK